MIRLNNITKTFVLRDRSVTALSGVSIHVPRGKIFGVIGASGAGKSTLIRCANLLEQPTSGEVFIDGKNLMELSRSALANERRHIGMIFQHFNLLSSRTVYQNVAFPLELEGASKAKIKERVFELLNFVGLEDKHADYPASLSGGQKQRVAIARTLAASPKVLLCDEATSALDPETTTSILKLLKDTNEKFGITILLITHEMQVVKAICDEVAIISQGVLVEQGTVSEMFSHPKSDLAKKFISSSIKVTLPSAYAERIQINASGSGNPVIKLSFNGDSADSAVLSEAAALFGVSNNIITAQIEHAAGIKFGTILVEAHGKKEDHERAIAYYKTLNIGVEVLGYV
ncbi:methionine ABC transporter ATP-binding protein MetN [Pedobacter nutrimenti]|uniref:methionine ABC transporter ATP-binding protein MetN n=1 Tax=Pedobacter nutrimenti TaxID=1241337 RepID=UPI0029313AC2|nr:methionine ABC transporter ATP-binding protein MetN [Pedobacter nutrimenti]